MAYHVQVPQVGVQVGIPEVVALGDTLQDIQLEVAHLPFGVLWNMLEA